MKTWQAALVHLGLGAAQSAAAVTYFDNSHTVGVLGNTAIQVGSQIGLALLQLWAAKSNSNSAPNGAHLTENLSGSYQSAPK